MKAWNAKAKIVSCDDKKCNEEIQILNLDFITVILLLVTSLQVEINFCGISR